MNKNQIIVLILLLIALFSKAQTFNRKLSKNDSLSLDGKRLITWNIKFYFVSDSIVTRESFDYIDSLTNYLKTNPDLDLEVGAHFILRGTTEFCCDLTQMRAAKISRLLTERGIEKKRLIAKGYGKTKPFFVDKSKCSHCYDDLRQKNLRVEFLILKKKKP